MPGYSILTNIDQDRAISIARAVALDLRYEVHRPEKYELKLQKGNFVASIFLGILVGPYCDFQVFVDLDNKGRCAIEIHRNTPWWTGLLGVSQVKSEVRRLAEEIEDEIEHIGGRVFDCEEF